MDALDILGRLLLEIGVIGFGVSAGFAVKRWLASRKTSGVDNGDDWE